jgi:hypothetical protein
MPIALVSEQSNVPEPIAAPRHTRRLSDRIAIPSISRATCSMSRLLKHCCTFSNSCQNDPRQGRIVSAAAKGITWPPPTSAFGIYGIRSGGDEVGCWAAMEAV